MVKKANNVRHIFRYIRNMLRYMRSGGVVYANVAQVNHTELLSGKKAVVTGATSGIAPGIVASNINHIDARGNIYTEEFPNFRVALPQEIAELAAFLASDAANHIVGQNIVCDGGQSILSV